MPYFIVRTVKTPDGRELRQYLTEQGNWSPHRSERLTSSRTFIEAILQARRRHGDETASISSSP